MTKSKGIGRGGRREGSGRPRFAKTGKSSYFSTRITRETRGLLEAEAERSGKTLSSVAGRLLQRALEQAAERRRPGSLSGLFFVLERLLEQIQGSGLDRSWRSSPYLFAAFRTAALEFLDRLRPAGEVVAPPPEKLQWVGENAEFGRQVFGDDYMRRYPESPEEYGRQRLELLLTDMENYAGGPIKLIGPDGKEFEVTRGDDEDPELYFRSGRVWANLGLSDRGKK